MALRPARPTIYDVAREAGVSKSLVSLVLNQSPLVAEAKREAVQEAIRRLGYRRQPGRLFAGQQSHEDHRPGHRRLQESLVR